MVVVGRGRKWWSMVVDVVNIVVTQWMVSCDDVVHPSQTPSYSDWYSDTWMIWIITVLWHVVVVARHDRMSFFEMMMMMMMTVVVWN